jgi:hypothetical protein
MVLNPSRALTLATCLSLLATLPLCLGACSDESLTALSPSFSIVWSEDQGFVEEDLEASSIQFGTVTTGAFAEVELLMANSGTADLEICDMYLASATFDENGDLANELRLQQDTELSTNVPSGEQLLSRGASQPFLVRFAPVHGTPLASDLHLVIKHELNWDCHHSAGAGLYVPIVGAGDGEPVPDIYAAPQSIDLGEVVVGGESVVHEVVIGNAGPGILHTGDVQISDEVNFTLSSIEVANLTFEPSQSGVLSVTFSPQTQGNFEEEIRVYSDDPDESPLVIPLVAIGNAAGVGKNPTAICGPDIISAPFETEQFDGSASVVQPLTYQWMMTPPTGSMAALNSYTIATPSIELDLAGTYVGVLTVTNSDGETASCSQNIEAIPNENFRIEMFWAQGGDDMDLHLLRPSGQWTGGGPRSDDDCYFSNCASGGGISIPGLPIPLPGLTSPDWGVSGVTEDNPNLDLDDISTTGPENINIIAPAQGGAYNGEYIVFVHDYPGSSYTPPNEVTVNIYLNGSLAQTFTFDHVGEDQDYYVAKIDWPSGAITPCSGVATSPAAGCP